MTSVIRTSVIQGYFMNRPVRGDASRPKHGHPSGPRPPSYQDLTLQAHQRSSGLLVQSSGNRNAFVVPPHLATFGRRAGQRLPLPVQQKMESFFGTDFSDVQVHSGPEASSIGALAFTRGSNIYFAPGQYNPNSHFGQALLAHELTHVVQQRAGRVRNPFGSGMAVVQDPMLEAEAERMGRQAATYQPFVQGKLRPFPANIQRAFRSGVAQRGGGGGAPPPILSAVHKAASDLEGACGYFVRVRDWHVTNPVQGIIVQEVQRDFEVKVFRTIAKKVTVKKLAGSALNKYIQDKRSCICATETHYWEAWEVDGAGNVGDGGDDTFSLCAVIPYKGKGGKKLKNTTVGKFEMTGNAQFYPTTDDPTKFGFARNAVKVAGGLFSKSTAPTGLPVAVPPVVGYTVTVTWDSSDPAKIQSTVVP